MRRISNLRMYSVKFLSLNLALSLFANELASFPCMHSYNPIQAPLDTS